MKKRFLTGQATIFVILGLVLIAVFAFALYARSLIVTEAMKEEAQETLSNIIQVNSVNYYVENCLQQVSNEALLAIAAGGGTLNFTEKNLWQDYYLLKEDGKEQNITYAVQPNTRCQEIIPTAPQYPIINTKVSAYTRRYAASSCKHDGLSGYIGMSTLPSLCYQNGPNSYQQIIGNLDLSCEQLSYTILDDNIQNNLQREITKNIQACADLTFFEETLGQHIELQEEDISTQVIFSKEATIINTAYPFKVRIGNGKNVIASYDFSYKSPYRIKKVYDFIMDLTQQENTLYDFNIREEYANSRNYDPSFKVSFLDNPCDVAINCQNEVHNGAKDDILRVVDEAEQVDTTNLMFQIAIKNRRPILDYIHDDNAGQGFDIKIIENETRTIEPKGYDPENNELSYAYSGWGEDYRTVLDYTCCSLQGGCTINNFNDCLYNKTDENGQVLVPHNWTLSEEYQQTRKSASINVSRNDTGIHTTRVTITDEKGLQDYQDIKIIVFDLPLAVITLNNGFANINDKYASIEDPYPLDGTESLTSTFLDEDISNYNWRGYEGEEKRFDFQGQAQELLPYSEGEYSFTETIKNGPITVEGNLPVKDYSIELSVTVPQLEESGIWSVPAAETIEVYACLPNRGDSPPFPYNTTTVYEYNHACCLGETNEGEPISANWGTIAGESTPCYQETKYGLLQSLIDHVNSIATGTPGNYYENNPQITKKLRYDKNAIATENDFTIAVTQLRNVKHEITNDVFVLEFIRTCDRERGNICGGAIEAIFTRVESCNDFTSIGYDDARCHGIFSGISDTQMSCRSFTFNAIYNEWSTFEAAIHQPGSTAYCNTDKVCMDKDDTYAPTGTKGDYLCQGGCAGSLGCTAPVNCACNYETCGAECDASQEHNTYLNEEENICYFGCSSSCSFTKEEQCLPAAQCDDYENLNGCKPPQLRTTPSSIQYCLTGRTDCDASAGCLYSSTKELRKDYCDQCGDTRMTAGNFCPSTPTVQAEDGTATCYVGGGTCQGTSCSAESFSLRSAATICEQRTYTQGIDDNGNPILKNYAGVQCTQGRTCCTNENDQNCYSLDEIKDLESTS